MVKKQSGGFKTVKYVSKPSAKDYQKAYKRKSSPEVKKKISEIYSAREKAYYLQQAKIATGDKESKGKYYTKKTLSVIREGLQKAAKQKVTSRSVLKKNSMVINIPDYKAPSILGDENRFFKGEMEKTKRSMFLE